MPTIEQLRTALASIEASKYGHFDASNPVFIAGVSEDDIVDVAARSAISSASRTFTGAALIIEPDDTIRSRINEILVSRISQEPANPDFISNPLK